MAGKRIKIIKDIDFYHLWKEANRHSTENEYIKSIGDWKYKKYGLDYIDYIFMLKNIYQASRMSFHQILNEKGLTKSQVSNAFCVPIRTIEDWYTGKNKCPDYFRLLLLRYYKILNLGKYIKVNAVYAYEADSPRKHEKKAQDESKLRETEQIKYTRKRDILKETDYLNKYLIKK